VARCAYGQNHALRKRSFGTDDVLSGVAIGGVGLRERGIVVVLVLVTPSTHPHRPSSSSGSSPVNHDGWVEVWPAVSSLLLPLPMRMDQFFKKREAPMEEHRGACKIQTNLNLHLSLLSFEEFVLPQQRRRIQICTFSRFSKWDVTEELVLFRASPAKYQPRVRRSGVQHTRSINRLGHRTKGQGTE